MFEAVSHSDLLFAIQESREELISTTKLLHEIRKYK